MRRTGRTVVGKNKVRNIDKERPGSLTERRACGRSVLGAPSLNLHHFSFQSVRTSCVDKQRA